MLILIDEIMYHLFFHVCSYSLLITDYDVFGSWSESMVLARNTLARTLALRFRSTRCCANALHQCDFRSDTTRSNDLFGDPRDAESPRPGVVGTGEASGGLGSQYWQLSLGIHWHRTSVQCDWTLQPGRSSLQSPQLRRYVDAQGSPCMKSLGVNPFPFVHGS